MSKSETHHLDLSRRTLLCAGVALVATSVVNSAVAAQTAAPVNAPPKPDDGMNRKRRLGPLEVSPMGLGCMSGSAFFYPINGS